MHSTASLLHVVGLGVYLAGAVLAQPMPLTGEFQVNEDQIDRNQDDPAVAMDALGNFVVTWESAGGPNADGIFARRYSSTATPLTPSDFQVNNNALGNQNEPDVAMDPNGRFVIVYESDNNALDSDGEGIHARLYNNAGVAQGNEFLVNKVQSFDQQEPVVAMATNGAFAVAWETVIDPGVFGFAPTRRIHMLRFDNNAGALDAAEIVVSQNPGDTSARNPDIAIQPNASRIVVVWQFGGDVFMRRFAGSGVPIGGQVQVNNEDFGNNECPTIGMDASGNFVIAWERFAGLSEGVFARQFMRDGTPVDDQFLVNTFTNNDQEDPATSVRTDSSGNFVIIWESDRQDGSGEGVFGQYYDSNGTPIPASNGEFMVNITTDRDQDDPAVAMAPNGNFVVAWESRQQETRGPNPGSPFNDGVFARLYAPPAVGTGMPDCNITGDASACPGSADVPYSVALSAGTGPATFTWSVMGDAAIDGPNVGSSVNVDVDPVCGSFVLKVDIVDALGATGSCTLPVTITDGTSPVLTVPADALNLECPAETTPLATGEATATDNCPAPVTVTCSDIRTEGCGDTYSIVRTWTATDVCGNFVSDTQTITVVDTTAPTLNVPSDLTVECGDDTSSAATLVATGSDTCGNVTITESDVFAPACGDTGVITRTWTATDECGLQTTGDQTITIVDTTPPTITCPSAVTILRGASIDPPDTGMATGSDACGDVTFGFVDDVEPAPSPIFEIITRTWTATDECGLTNTCDQVITVEDYCVWDQGDWNGIDGQTSEIDTAVSESRTADDFCLKEGYVYEVERICVMMITDSDEPDATLQIYADCNGCPGEPIDCGLANVSNMTRMGRNVDGEGRDLYQFDFNFAARTEVDEYGNEVEIPGLWLKGGCYWVSPQGIGDGSGYDRYFWATSGDQVISAVPKTQAGPFKIDGWETVDGLNVECSNFAFRLHGEKCCILQDNGPPADDVAGAVDTTRVGCANADDFVLPRCSEAEEICFFSTYVWTNCDCTRTKLEILADDCGVPTGDQFGTRNGTTLYLADKCVDMKRTITFDGQQLTLYRVEWHNLGIPLVAAPACNGWASIHVQGTGSLGERGVVAFADRCDTDCDGSFSPGHAICPPDEVFDWTGVDRDYSFCIATRGGEVYRAPNNNASEEPQGCAADFNGDGVHSISDMLSFLQVWFDGCP